MPSTTIHIHDELPLKIAKVAREGEHPTRAGAKGSACV